MAMATAGAMPTRIGPAHSIYFPIIGDHQFDLWVGAVVKSEPTPVKAMLGGFAVDQCRRRDLLLG
jgi:hypothetical protein